MENHSYKYFFVIFGIAVFGIANLALITLVRAKAAKNYFEIRELNRPANLEASIIKKQDCDGCKGVSSIVEFISKQNVKLISKEVDADSE
ncbi:MAG: hypothetical protein AAB731_00665, partial [Patescibacteria group bacterium]